MSLIIKSPMNEAEKRFIAFTAPYLAYGDMIRLKIDHSLRVRDLCADIARHLCFSPADTETAALCGLLHDIGRFEQWRRFGTFDDLASADHGDLGEELLRTDGLLEAFADHDHDVILAAAVYHGRYSLPDTLDARTRMFVNITRDADKIDILSLLADRGQAKKTHGSIISSPVYRAALNGKAIRKQDMTTKADVIAMYLALVFDLNYRISFELLEKNGSIGRIITMQTEETDSPELKQQLQELHNHVNLYIRGQLDSPDTRTPAGAGCTP